MGLATTLQVMQLQPCPRHEARNILIDRGYPFNAYAGRDNSSVHGNESLPTPS